VLRLVADEIDICPRHLGSDEVHGRDVLWRVDVADSTLTRDLVRRAGSSRSMAPQRLVAWTHAEPVDGAYRQMKEHAARARLAPSRFPQLPFDRRDVA
jgi:hypothetical protein